MLDITKFILLNVNIHVLVYPMFACIYSKLIYYKLSVPMSRQELSSMDRSDLTFYNFFLGMRPQPQIHYQLDEVERPPRTREARNLNLLENRIINYGIDGTDSSFSVMTYGNNEE